MDSGPLLGQESRTCSNYVNLPRFLRRLIDVIDRLADREAFFQTVRRHLHLEREALFCQPLLDFVSEFSDRFAVVSHVPPSADLDGLPAGLYIHCPTASNGRP